MVRLTRIYTRTGDTGMTSLGDGRRVPKHTLRVDALGMIDEANATLGIALAHIKSVMPKSRTCTVLQKIQNDLFDIGAELCVTEEVAQQTPRQTLVEQSMVDGLETEIDIINTQLPPLDSFILPGGTIASSHMHMARAVVRRAERRITELAANEKVEGVILRYLNRLSDYLFVVGRDLNLKADGEEILWEPGAGKEKTEL